MIIVRMFLDHDILKYLQRIPHLPLIFGTIKNNYDKFLAILKKDT